ncbi:MAG: hypothetical protein GXX78_12870 [Bacteroidales bacterium]|nr:hypothetical protein [Bacteroidales bacterium]
MHTKDRLHIPLKRLADSFSIDELIDQLFFIEKVEDGLQQSEEGRIVSNEDV